MPVDFLLLLRVPLIIRLRFSLTILSLVTVTMFPRSPITLRCQLKTLKLLANILKRCFALNSKLEAKTSVQCYQTETDSLGFISEWAQSDGPESTVIRSAKLVKRVNTDVDNVISKWTDEDLGVECSQ